MSSDMSFTFNWHEEPEGFLKWAWISLVQGWFNESGTQEEIMTATDGGKSITLSVFVDGREMNARNMMESLERNYEHAVQKGVREAVKAVHMDTLEETLLDVEKAAQAVLRERLALIGITWEDDNDEW